MTPQSTSRLAEIFAERRATLVPGAFNALSARVIADLGYEAVYVTGAGVTNGLLGVPDIGLITVTELAGTVAAIRDAVDLPLIVDADTGFGNAVNTVRTVRTLERAGADAIQIEDQVFPKKCGHFSGKDVVGVGEIVSKIKAAVDTRDRLLVVARTDARAIRGLDDAIERAQRFVEAGADAVFIEAPRTPDELRRIAREVDAPHFANMVIGGLTPVLPRSELEEYGFSVVLYANAALQAALTGMQAVLTRLKEEGRLEEAGGMMATFAERQRIVGKPHFDALERKYAVSDD
ncbi:MAG: oxaloacetate decarboxylase [Aquamicrobium sp.]|nr:oxaloacetate decarboxylase [Aquamicrobium sp.]